MCYMIPFILTFDSYVSVDWVHSSSRMPFLLSDYGNVYSLSDYGNYVDGGNIDEYFNSAVVYLTYLKGQMSTNDFDKSSRLIFELLTYYVSLSLCWGFMEPYIVTLLSVGRPVVNVLYNNTCILMFIRLTMYIHVGGC